MRHIALATFLLFSAAPVVARAQAVRERKTAVPSSSESITEFRLPYGDECPSPFVESTLLESIKGKVIKVIDGNTIELVTESREQKHVVLIGLEAPIWDEPYSYSSLAALEGLVLNKDVEVSVTMGQAKNENLYGVVRTLNTDVNQTLLEIGAVRFKSPDTNQISSYNECVYRILESKARAAKVGLWQTVAPEAK